MHSADANGASGLPQGYDDFVCVLAADLEQFLAVHLAQLEAPLLVLEVREHVGAQCKRVSLRGRYT